MALPAHSPRLTFPVRESTSPVKEGSSEHGVPDCWFDSVHSPRSVLKKAVRYRGELRNIQAPQTRVAGSVSVARLLRASAKGPSSGPFHPFTLPSSTPTSFGFSCRAGRKYTCGPSWCHYLYPDLSPKPHCPPLLSIVQLYSQAKSSLKSSTAPVTF